MHTDELHWRVLTAAQIFLNIYSYMQHTEESSKVKLINETT